MSFGIAMDFWLFYNCFWLFPAQMTAIKKSSHFVIFLVFSVLYFYCTNKHYLLSNYINHQKQFQACRAVGVLHTSVNSTGHKKFYVLPFWQRLTGTEDGLAWIHFVTKIATRIQNSTILINFHENDGNENEKWHQLNPFSLLCYDCNLVALS